ncbi:MAG: dipicolinate synthase subunit DpsA [Candidatus Niameybacter stercoravium]|nr:dipicolinate synthase subunit DpsA [Candidatus Niameybacter stercoravium]
MNNISIAVVGGDLRFVRLCKILCDKGFDTWVFGITHPDIPQKAHIATSLEDLKVCQYVVGPIPFTRDGKNLFTPLGNTSISIEMFIENVSHAYLCLSVIKEDMKKLFEKYNPHYIDLMEMDEVAILNAIPTAEGAIQYAMQNSEITLNDSKCLILGFGRCGKILAHKLKGIGARVYVEARSTQDLAYISTYDYVPIPLYDLKKHLWKFDFIFNTIPVPILTAEYIDLFPKNVVYIELASVPGIDKSYSQASGIHYVPAPSLPGKVAPMTAASILYQGLTLIMLKQGEKL